MYQFFFVYLSIIRSCTFARFFLLSHKIPPFVNLTNIIIVRHSRFHSCIGCMWPRLPKTPHRFSWLARAAQLAHTVAPGAGHARGLIGPRTAYQAPCFV